MVNGMGRCNRGIIIVLLLVFCSVSLTGCASFRRKFVRQSKNKEVKEDFMPVLEPVEYKRVEAAPMDTYKSHYAMVGAYFSDVYADMAGRDRGEKRERYLLSQIAAHLQGMAALLNDPRKQESLMIVSMVEEAMKELDKPAGLQRIDFLKSSVHQVETKIRRTLKPDMVKEFITVQ